MSMDDAWAGITGRVSGVEIDLSAVAPRAPFTPEQEARIRQIVAEARPEYVASVSDGVLTGFREVHDRRSASPAAEDA